MKKITAMILLLAMVLAPVSYTHLDVYKRQRSSLPFRKARRVNSPGPACRDVYKRQGQLRFARGLRRAGHAEGLDGVPSLADAGRVRQTQQHAADAHRLLDGVARCSGDVRDDDAVIALSLIHL